MGKFLDPFRYATGLLAVAILATFTGCSTLARWQISHSASSVVDPTTMPRELHKTTLPVYVIEPPDILLVEATHMVPKPPYLLRSADVMALQVQGTLPDAPLDGPYVVEPGGVINLGSTYGGAVKVAGLSREAAENAIIEHLKGVLKEPNVSLTITSMAGMQVISGEHLVGPDGTITLGTYGSVYVAGMTRVQAKAAIERHLSKYLEDPEVSVDLFAYNSKSYYIITAGAGTGDRLAKFPITGNETVLDALSEVQGLSAVSSKRIWIARPTDEVGGVQVLPVDWQAIVSQGSATTNFQLLPGDRLFIAEDNLIAFDTALAKLLAPAERVFGFSLLAVNTVTRFSGKVLQGGGNQIGNIAINRTP